MKAHRGRSQVILEALRRDLNERRKGFFVRWRRKRIALFGKTARIHCNEAGRRNFADRQASFGARE